MSSDSPDVVVAIRLLDNAKLRSFQFRRTASGPDGPLLGTRRSHDWTDTIHLAGFSRDCYALRERSTSLVVPDGVLVERRVTGDALKVLKTVLSWDMT